MTDPPIEMARELVERAEERYHRPNRRETHYGVWEADEAAVEALEVLEGAETPAALELEARATAVRAAVATALDEVATPRERYGEAARLGEAAGTSAGLEVAADAWEVAWVLAELGDPRARPAVESVLDEVRAWNGTGWRYRTLVRDLKRAAARLEDAAERGEGA